MGLFSEIPLHNQAKILKKLDFKDFIKFKKCSQETLEITRNFRHRFPLKLSALNYDAGHVAVYPDSSANNGEYLDFLKEEPVKVDFLDFHFKGEVWKESVDWLIDFYRKVPSTVETMTVFNNDYIEHDSSIIGDIVKILNVKELQILGFSNLDLQRFVSIAGTQTLKKIQLDFGDILESSLLHLKTDIIFISNVDFDFSDIPVFLKQWLSGERETALLQIIPMHRAFPVVFENMKMDVLWTSESHETSPFADLERPEEDPIHQMMMICSLTREDGKKLCVALGKNTISAFTYKDVQDIKNLWTKLKDLKYMFP